MESQNNGRVSHSLRATVTGRGNFSLTNSGWGDMIREERRNEANRGSFEADASITGDVNYAVSNEQYMYETIRHPNGQVLAEGISTGEAVHTRVHGQESMPQSANQEMDNVGSRVHTPGNEHIQTETAGGQEMPEDEIFPSESEKTAGQSASGGTSSNIPSRAEMRHRIRRARDPTFTEPAMNEGEGKSTNTQVEMVVEDKEKPNNEQNQVECLIYQSS